MDKDVCSLKFILSGTIIFVLSFLICFNIPFFPPQTFAWADSLNGADVEGNSAIVSDKFGDVDANAWYTDAVQWAYDYDVMTGYNDTVFGVGNDMTRADFVTVLWRYLEPEAYAAYNEKSGVNRTNMPDVEDGTYYTEAVNWAVSNNIVTGYDDGFFGSYDPITFEQLITVLGRYELGYEDVQERPLSVLDDKRFRDGNLVDTWAVLYMAWAVESGYVTGNNNGDGTYTLAPLVDVARERAVTVLYRIFSIGSAVYIDGLSDTEVQTALYLSNLGWDNIQIAAVMGNIDNEGSWDVSWCGTDVTGEIVCAGLFPFWGNEATSFLDWCSTSNVVWDTVDAQMGWVFDPCFASDVTNRLWSDLWKDNVCRSGYYASDSGYPSRWDSTPDAFLAETDIDVATFSWMACYEKPANGSYSHLDRRIESARKYYEILTNPIYSGDNEFVARAYEQLGKPYVWGAADPDSFDDSGLVSYCVTGEYGTRLGTTETFYYNLDGHWSQVTDPQPGDICTSLTHCGIYIGNGQLIDAPHTSAVVRIDDVSSGMIYVRYSE